MPWLSGLLIFLNIAILLILHLSWLAVAIDPNEFSWFAFFGLIFPYSLIICLLFSFIWWLKKKRYAWVNLLLVAPTFILFQRLYKVFPATEELLEEDIQITSYNVRNFDLYNWSNNNETKNQIMDFLKLTDPDILCIQEFFNTTDPLHDFKTLEILEDELKASHSHIDYTNTVNGTENWGIATFSAYPIVAKHELRFPLSPNNICIITDVLHNQDTLRIYNVHLASIHFDRDDYSFLREKQPPVDKQQVVGWGKILKKLNKAYKLRAIQVNSILENIEESPYPVILCGDFNDIPISYAYQQFSEHLNDAFLESGSGEGRTYNGIFPSYRIDYIFSDVNFSSYNFKVHPEKHSDHYPISATLRKL